MLERGTRLELACVAITRSHTKVNCNILVPLPLLETIRHPELTKKKVLVLVLLVLVLVMLVVLSV